MQIQKTVYVSLVDGADNHVVLPIERFIEANPVEFEDPQFLEEFLEAIATKGEFEFPAALMCDDQCTLITMVPLS